MSREDHKRAAARAAMEFVQPGKPVGVGSGSTVNHFIEALGAARDRVAAGGATSVETAGRLAKEGIRVIDLTEVERLELFVDGADEVDPGRQLIKGGGGAHTREKIVAEASDYFVCVVDESKLVDRLGAFPLPVEVIPMAARHVAHALAPLGGRAVERPDFVTDNGNLILDVHGLRIEHASHLETDLNQIAGVVAVGLFAHRFADLVLVGSDSGVRRID
jgi:ribose 5-phosphate isomerase A